MYQKIRELVNRSLRRTVAVTAAGFFLALAAWGVAGLPQPIDSVAALSVDITGHPTEWHAQQLRAKRPPSTPISTGVTVSGTGEWVPISPLANGSYVNFESPPVKPIAVSSNGLRVFAVNVPNNSLIILDPFDGLSTIAEVPVGLDPVSIAVQPGAADQIVWVANFISDSVSVVNASTARVEAIVEVGDEPVNILFDSTGSYAFVVIQGSAPPNVVALDSLNLRRGNLVVIDTATKAIVSMSYLDCLTPRAAVYDPINQRVIVAALNSGNNTTVVGTPISLHKNAPLPSFPDLCEVDCNCDCEHATSLSIVRDFSLTAAIFAGASELGPEYPDLHVDPMFPMPAPLVQRIIPDDGQPAAWQQIVDILSDSNGQPDPAVVQQMAVEFDISNALDVVTTILADSLDTLDHDLVILDASAPASPSGLPVLAHKGEIGTTLTGMTFDAIRGLLLVSNMEARNLVRHEPALKGHIVNHRIELVEGLLTPTVARFSLDLHAAIPNFDDVSFVNPAAQAASLANPIDVVADPARAVAFVASLGADRVGAIDYSSRAVLNVVDVGRGPRGLALDPAADLLYVYNRTDLSISSIDVSDPGAMSVVHTVRLFNPEPTQLRAGRHFLYSSRVSNNFASSCAVCHVDGHTDHLVWDLGNPAGGLDDAPPNLQTNPGVPRHNHPLKGPMFSQSLRGLAGHARYHWRSDRENLQSFNPAFANLLGGEQLTETEINAFAAFLDSIVYAPNPYATRANAFHDSAQVQIGANAFQVNCAICHHVEHDGAMVVENVSGDGGVDLNVPSLQAQLQEVAQLRFAHTKFDAPRYTGFGILHDGRIGEAPTGHALRTFIARFFSGVSAADRDPIIAFVAAFPTNVMNVVGWQVRIEAPPVGGPDPSGSAQADIARMVAQYAKMPSHCDVIARRTTSSETVGYVLTAAVPEPTFESDVGAVVSLPQLVAALAPGDTLIVTAVPPGSGRRIGVDQDMDGISDRVDPHPRHANTGDFDGDGHVTMTDFQALVDCAAEPSPLPAACHVFDPDLDAVLDSLDFNAFLNLFEAPLFDCNNNLTLDLIDILIGTSLDADRDGVPDDCSTISVAPAGSRYIAIAVTGEQTTALRVSPINYDQLPQFVDPDGRLVADPIYRLPSEWGTVYVGDRDVVPSTFYVVTSMTATSSVTRVVTTFAWGDTNDADGVTLDDILCSLSTFSGGPANCSLYGADLMGFTPDRVVNLDDILAVLAAFSGAAYPGPAPGE